MRKIWFILVLLLVTSCGNNDNYFTTLNVMDPDLAGSWWDTNTIYTFSEISEDNITILVYGEKHIRSGVGQDSIVTDSVYGTFDLDLDRKNITFNVKGWITKSGDTVAQELNSTTWNYSITDTIMTYESSTTLGTLTRYTY